MPVGKLKIMQIRWPQQITSTTRFLLIYNTFFFFPEEIFLWYVKQVRYQQLESYFVFGLFGFFCHVLCFFYRSCCTGWKAPRFSGCTSEVFVTFRSKTRIHTHQTMMIFLQMYLYFVINYVAHSKNQSDTCEINALMANTPISPYPPFWEWVKFPLFKEVFF